MSALGVRLTVLAGPTLPVPLPAPLTERLRAVEVTENDQKRSVFTLTFDAGGAGHWTSRDRSARRWPRSPGWSCW